MLIFIKIKKINKEELAKIVNEEEYSKAYSYTLNYLGYRMRSIKEIQDKLKEKCFEENNIEDVILKFLKLNYLNCKDFVKAFVKTKLNTKKHGPIKVKYDLMNKGVEQNIIDKTLKMLYPKEVEEEICFHIAYKKANKYKKMIKQNFKDFYTTEVLTQMLYQKLLKKLFKKYRRFYNE